MSGAYIEIKPGSNVEGAGTDIDFAFGINIFNFSIGYITSGGGYSEENIDLLNAIGASQNLLDTDSPAEFTTPTPIFGGD